MGENPSTAGSDAAIPVATTTPEKGADRHSDNPTSIPANPIFWSDNAGITGRFPSESVVGFFRNHWSDNVGILTLEPPSADNAFSSTPTTHQRRKHGQHHAIDADP
jgi:hypothetical protein